MRILPEPIAFEWDAGNQEKNFLRHKVTTQETEETFNHEPKFILEDEKHSLAEKRYGLLGETRSHRKISIVFTLRSNKIRIITARDMSRKERLFYEELKNHSSI